MCVCASETRQREFLGKYVVCPYCAILILGDFRSFHLFTGSLLPGRYPLLNSLFFRFYDECAVALRLMSRAQKYKINRVRCHSSHFCYLVVLFFFAASSFRLLSAHSISCTHCRQFLFPFARPGFFVYSRGEITPHKLWVNK